MEDIIGRALFFVSAFSLALIFAGLIVGCVVSSIRKRRGHQ
jgi:hypothetical protein